MSTPYCCSPYCECEKDKCNNGYIDIRGKEPLTLTIRNEMKAVKVLFAGGNQTYTYACFDVTVKEGDKVVVDSPRDGPVIVTVTEVLNNIPKVVTKAIVCKFDIEQYQHNQKRLEVYLEAKSKLDAKLAKFQELHVYEILAQQDQEASDLLRIVKGY